MIEAMIRLRPWNIVDLTWLDGDCCDWAVLASTPNTRSSQSHPNRVAPPTCVADDEGPFEVVHSKKAKLHRVESHQQQQQQQWQRASNGEDNSCEQQRRPSSTLYGKSTVATNLTAATKLQKKKTVFCIDNISTECHNPLPPLAWYSTRRSADYSARQDKTGGH